MSLTDFIDDYVRPKAEALDQDNHINWLELSEALRGFEIIDFITSEGQGVNRLNLFRTIRAVSRHCSNTRNVFLVSFGMFLEALRCVENQPDQMAEAYSEVLAGKSLGAIAFTGDKSSGQESITILERAGGVFVMNGKKSWVTLGGGAKYLLVSCAMEGTRVLVLLESQLRGVRMRLKEKLMGNRGSMLAEFEFDNVKIHPDCVLPNIVSPGISGESNLLTFARLAAAESALGVGEAALFHAGARVISNEQNVAIHKLELGILEARKRALNGFLDAIVQDGGPPTTSSTPTAVAAKLVASSFARDAADLLAKASGARAFSEADISNRLWREAQGLQFIEGSDSMLANYLGSISVIEASVD